MKDVKDAETENGRLNAKIKDMAQKALDGNKELWILLDGCIQKMEKEEAKIKADHEKEDAQVLFF